MATDGTLKFDTKVDTSGMKSDLNSVGTVAKGVFAADMVEAFAAKAGQALTSAAKGAVEIGASFESSMSQVAATMGITAEQIAAGDESFIKLSEAAKEMGATTKYTASEAAEGLNILAMAGLSADEAIETLPSVLALSAAGAIDMSTAASYVTGAIKGFADSMDNAGMYADIMAKGATMANTDVNALGEAMSGSAATANAYGQSVDTTTIALLRLAEQNVTGSEAATAMSRAMADLYTPTSNGAKALEELGVSMYDTNGDARDFNDVVDELNGKLSEMSMEEQLAYENTIFTTLGMKAFQKMTVSSAETVERFAQGIEEAGGSAMQQMNTQIDNLEGKLAILNSATESVGIAFYEIFEDTMKNSVEHASDAMTRLQKAMTQGRLADSLKRLAQAVGNFADRAINAAEDALPAVIDGLTWILDHSAQIKAGIMSIGTGFLVFKTVTGLMTAAQVALTLFSTVTGSATAAQWALNAAMYANPIGAIVAAVAALTVGIVALTKAMTDCEWMESEVVQEAQAAADALDATVEQIENNAKARSEAMSEVDSQAGIARRLADELLNLNGKAELTASEQERMKQIVEQLNTIYPDLNLELDEYGHLTEENAAALDKTVDAMIRQAKAAAAQEKITEIAKDHVELETELAEIEKKIIAQTAAKEEAYEKMRAEQERLNYEYEQGIRASTAADDAATEAADAYWAEAEALNILQLSYDKHKGKVDEVVAEYDVYYGIIDDVERQTQEAAEANEDFAGSFDQVSDAASKMSEEMAEAYDDLSESLKKSVESQTELFGDYKDASEVTFDSVKKKLTEQIEAMQSWSENIKKLADKGINEGLLKTLEEMGPEGAAYVQQFVNMTDEELGEINTLYTEKMALEDTTVQAVAGSWYQAATTVADTYSSGLYASTLNAALAGDAIAMSTLEGVKNSPAWAQLDAETQERINAALQSAAEATSTAENTGNEISYSTLKGLEGSEAWKHLPLSVQGKVTGATNEATPFISQEAEKAGEAYPEGMALGIENNSGVVEDATQNVAQTGLDTINSTAGTTNGASTETQKTGENIDAGLVNGIENGSAKVESAAKEMATSVVNVTKETLDKQIFVKIGEDIDEGLATGLRNGIDNVKKAAGEVGEAAKSATKDSVDSHSPSKDFEKIGEMCVVGFEQGLEPIASGSIVNNIAGSIATMSARGTNQPQNIVVENRVTLEGDANRLFTAIVNKNASFVRTTGIAPLNLSPA